MKAFHPSCLKWCVMHAVNLGILFTCNGGSLMHILILASLFDFRVGAPHFRTHQPSLQNAILLGHGCWGLSLRMLLIDLLYFGPGPFAEQLDTAYKSFVAFCRWKKINQSQPPFTDRMVSWFKNFTMVLVSLFTFMVWGRSNIATVVVTVRECMRFIILIWKLEKTIHALFNNLGAKEKNGRDWAYCKSLEWQMYPELAVPYFATSSGVASGQ